MKTNAYWAWRRRLDHDVFTGGECRQWCRAVVPLAEGLSPGGRYTLLRRDEAAELVGLLTEAGSVGITPEHAAELARWARAHRPRTHMPVIDTATIRFVRGHVFDRGARPPVYEPVYSAVPVSGRPVLFSPARNPTSGHVSW